MNEVEDTTVFDIHDGTRELDISVVMTAANRELLNKTKVKLRL